MLFNLQEITLEETSFFVFPFYFDPGKDVESIIHVRQDKRVKKFRNSNLNSALNYPYFSKPTDIN